MASTTFVCYWKVALAILSAIFSHTTTLITDQLPVCSTRCTCSVSLSAPITPNLTVNCSGGIAIDLTSPTFRLPHQTKVLIVTGSSSSIDLLSLATVLLRDTTALTDLSINRVRLQSLNGLAAPETLVNLDLSQNLLSMIPDRAFVRVIGLRQLDLSYNRLEVINHEAFYGLQDLTRLDLSSNRLATNADGISASGMTPGRWICCLPSIVQLNLSRNGYHVIHDSFFDCRNQQSTAYRNSRITRRHSATMPTTVSSSAEEISTQSPYLTSSPPVRYLDFSFNRIRHIGEHAFFGLKAVSELRLNDNAMTSLPAAAIRQLSQTSNISVLDLSGNEMEVIDTESFHDNDQLVRLQLNRLDRLRLVERHAFVNMTSLTTLEMSNCRHLRHVHRKAFDSVPLLSSLSLNGGSLETLEQDVVRPLINLKLLDLRSNPLIGDCTTDWIKNSTDENPNSANSSFPTTRSGLIFRIEVDPFPCSKFDGRNSGSRDHKQTFKTSAQQENEVLPTVPTATISSAFLFPPPTSLPPSTLSGPGASSTSSSLPPTAAGIESAQWQYGVEFRRNTTRLSGNQAAQSRQQVTGSVRSTTTADRRADRASGVSATPVMIDSYNVEISRSCRPRILTMFDSDIHVSVTDTVRLDCIAVGLSELTTTWKLPASEHVTSVVSSGTDDVIEQFEDSNESSLTQVTTVNGRLLIRAVTVHHHGNYTCLATVASGNGSWHTVDERTVRIHVKSPNTGLIVLRMTSSTVTVTWRGLQPSRDYRVRYRERWRHHQNDSATGSHVTSVDSADVIVKPYMRSFTASDLSPNKEYVFCIDVRQSPTSMVTGSNLHESPVAAMLSYPYPGVPGLPFVTVNCTSVVTRHRKYADQLVRSRGVHILVLCATAFVSASLVVAMATFITKRYDRRKQRQLAAAAAALDSSSIIVTSSLDTSQLQLTSSGSMTSCVTSSLTFENRGAAINGIGADPDDYDYVPMFDSDDLEEIRMTTSMQL